MHNVKNETFADATDVNTFLCQQVGLCVSVCVCVFVFTHWESPQGWCDPCTVAGKSHCPQAFQNWKAGTRCTPWIREGQRHAKHMHTFLYLHSGGRDHSTQKPIIWHCYCASVCYFCSATSAVESAPLCSAKTLELSLLQTATKQQVNRAAHRTKNLMSAWTVAGAGYRNLSQMLQVC